MDRAQGSVEFSSRDVARITGLTLRQIQWLDEQQIVSPAEFRSRKRFYSREQVCELVLYRALRKKGLNPRSAFTAAKACRPRIREIDRDHRSYLIVLGKSVYCESEPGRALERAATGKQVCILQVHEILRSAQAWAGGDHQ